jgi:hypothetical protein
MSTPLVISVTDELVAEIQRDFDRNGPCPHFNWNPLGSGDWIHCDDCGQQVGIEHLESAKAASEKHGNLSVVLRSILAERAELLRDAERYAFVKTMPAEMLLAWRGMYGFADEAIDAAMQPEARP